MSGLKTSFARIHNVNAPAELKFSAAMVASAVEAAKGGDCEAYAWIERCSLRWLHAVTPDGDDCERILAKLLEAVPEPVCEPGTFGNPIEAWKPHARQHFRAGAKISDPSETAGYWQSSLPGLGMEAPHGNATGLPALRPRTRDPTARDSERRVA